MGVQVSTGIYSVPNTEGRRATRPQELNFPRSQCLLPHHHGQQKEKGPRQDRERLTQ